VIPDAVVESSQEAIRWASRAAAVRFPGMIRNMDVWQWVLLPTVIVLGLIFGLPLAALISVSFHESMGPATASKDFTLGNYAAFVEDPFYFWRDGRDAQARPHRGRVLSRHRLSNRLFPANGRKKPLASGSGPPV
jgi:hypothetical protein